MIKHTSIGDLLGWVEIQYLAYWVTYVAIWRYTYGAGENIQYPLLLFEQMLFYMEAVR